MMTESFKGFGRASRAMVAIAFVLLTLTYRTAEAAESGVMRHTTNAAQIASDVFIETLVVFAMVRWCVRDASRRALAVLQCFHYLVSVTSLSDFGERRWTAFLQFLRMYG